MVTPADILNARILVVDDLEANVSLLERTLRGAGYTAVTSTMDAREVCDLHQKKPYDLILLDLQMPCMDGFQVMENLKTIETGGYLPVLVVTAQPAHKLRALQAGAKDFISKPFDLVEVLTRAGNMLEVRLLHKQTRRQNEVLEQRVRERTATLQESYLETIFTMTRAAERKDEDTGAHVQRISYYARELACALGMDDEFIDTIFFASPMHDIGKIGIPDNILLKPHKLNPDELGIMRGHAAMGAKILGDSKSPYLKMAADIALNHHEQWDGGGYPNGRVADAVSMAARITHICDIYDALRCKRPYKPAFDHPKTVDIILQGDERTAPRHFDPMILEIFKQRHHLFRDLFEEHTQMSD